MATHYVHPLGNDDDPGTEDRPWQTVNKAATTAAAGDTIIFEDGDYTMHGGQSRWNSGDADNPITFKARSRRATTWVQSARGSALIDLDSQNHLVFQGIVVRGDQAFALDNHLRMRNCDDVTLNGCEICDGHGHGIRIQGGCTNITIHECTVHPENTDYPRDGIHIVGDGNRDIVIDQTEVYHCEHAGIDVNLVDGLVISSCHVHDTGSHCISIGDSDATGRPLNNITIRDCVIHDSDTGYGESPSSYHNGVRIHRNAANVEICRSCIYRNHTSGVYVRSNAIGPVNIHNNTLFDNNQSAQTVGAGAVRFRYEEANTPVVRFKNNIVFVTQDACAYNLASRIEDNLDLDYNLLYSTSGTTEVRRNGTTYSTFAAYKAAGFEPHTIVAADPDMVDPRDADFSLNRSSPAIDAGVDVGLSYHGAAPDIGAYEYKKGCLLFPVAGFSGSRMRRRV